MPRFRRKKYEENEIHRAAWKDPDISRKMLLENIKESMWVSKRKTIDQGLKFLAIKYALTTGIILGSQVAFIANFFFVIITAFANKFHLFASLWFFAAPVIVGLVALYYDRKYFRNYYYKIKDVVHSEYLRYRNKANTKIT